MRAGRRERTAGSRCRRERARGQKIAVWDIKEEIGNLILRVRFGAMLEKVAVEGGGLLGKRILSKISNREEKAKAKQRMTHPLPFPLKLPVHRIG